MENQPEQIDNQMENQTTNSVEQTYENPPMTQPEPMYEAPVETSVVNTPEENQTETPTVPVEPTLENPKGNKKKILFIIIPIVLVVIIAIVLIFVLKEDKPKNPTPTPRIAPSTRNCPIFVDIPINAVEPTAINTPAVKRPLNVFSFKILGTINATTAATIVETVLCRAKVPRRIFNASDTGE